MECYFTCANCGKKIEENDVYLGQYDTVCGVCAKASGDHIATESELREVLAETRKGNNENE